MAEVAIRDLTVEYSSGGYAARPFDHYDLELTTGELVVLLGASGCGKSTLLSILGSLLQPTSGSVTVDGQEITKLSGKELVAYRRHTIGFVFQGFNLIPSLNAQENVEMPMLSAGMREGRRPRLLHRAAPPRRSRRARAPQARRHVGRAAATCAIARDRDVAQARARRRTHGVARLPAGRRRAASPPRPRRARPHRGDRHPRRTTAPPRRPRWSSPPRPTTPRDATPSASSSRRVRSCSTRAIPASSCTRWSRARS
ncbi:MAG: ABC transporter ATP-binding protein [Acidimicrobiia bacterium]